MFKSLSKILYIHLEEALLLPKQEDIIDSDSIPHVRNYIKLIEPDQINIISQTCITKKDNQGFWKNAVPFLQDTIGLDLKISKLINANDYISTISKYFKDKESHISDRTRLGLLNNKQLAFYMYAYTKYANKNLQVYYINRHIPTMSLFRENNTDIICLSNRYIPQYAVSK